MMTKKQIAEMYKGKRLYENNPFSTITTISHSNQYAILMSGHYSSYESGYEVEACIDRSTGENIIEGHCRPCYSKQDAIDVAQEIIYDEGIDVEIY